MLRVISMVFASLASITGLIFPFALARQANSFNQTILMVMMAAVCGAFVYGVGIRPKMKWLDIVIGPLVTWPVLAGTVGSLMILR